MTHRFFVRLNDYYILVRLEMRHHSQSPPKTASVSLRKGRERKANWTLTHPLSYAPTLTPPPPRGRLLSTIDRKRSKSQSLNPPEIFQRRPEVRWLLKFENKISIKKPYFESFAPNALWRQYSSLSPPFFSKGSLRTSYESLKLIFET